MNDLFLSIVIPAYNEEQRIGSTLERILHYLKPRGRPFELVVVDDGSGDRTADIAREFGTNEDAGWSLRLLPNDGNRGKGYSVRRGMLEAQGAYALLTDADLSSPIEEIAKLEKEVVDGSCDIAFGSRDLKESDIQVRQSWFRETSGKIFNRLVRLSTGLPYADTQCGFKLFKMSSCRDLFRKQTIEGLSFDVEILYMARKWGLTLKEVPVVWRHSEGSRVRFAPDAFQMAWDLLRIRWNDARGKYRQLTTDN
jgi:dolichyl-phosphate beta-glucosyltransferase